MKIKYSFLSEQVVSYLSNYIYKLFNLSITITFATQFTILCLLNLAFDLNRKMKNE